MPDYTKHKAKVQDHKTMFLIGYKRELLVKEGVMAERISG